MTFYALCEFMYNAVACTNRTVQIADAATNAHEAYCDESMPLETRVHRIGSEAFFAVAQCTEAYTASGDFSSEVRLGTKTAAGLLDVARISSEKTALQRDLDFSDYLDVGNRVLSRSADVVKYAASECPDTLYCQHENASKYANLVGSISSAYSLRKPVSRAYNLYNRSELSNCSHVSQVSTDALSQEPRRQTQRSSSIHPPRRHRRTERFGTTRYRPEVEIVLRAESINDLSTIPTLFQNDEVLSQWMCPISRKPIRYIVMIKESINPGTPVWYERAEINRLIQAEQCPPSWPSGIPFNESSLNMHNMILQHLIDSRLRTLMQNFRREYSSIPPRTRQTGAHP